MKKNFISLSAFAVWMLSATMLTACGDDVQMPEKDSTEAEISTKTTASTIFSTGDDGTRTWMDTERRFYWSEGDQIYVNTDGANYKKTSSSKLSNDKRTADFVLEGVSLTAKKCSLMYIGNGTTAATAAASDLKVKIESTQTQSQWGNSDHLGTSGDCGFTEAERDDATGIYSFKLTHKAAYLIFQPHIPPYKQFEEPTLKTDWKLMKIEIISNGATTLAGEYPFGTGGLGTGTNTSNTVTFNCGADGFDLNHTAASAAKSCFAVIQPGSHELTIRYTVKVIKRADIMYLGLAEDGIFTVEKKIAARPYNANGVTTIKHALAMASGEIIYYQWGAADPYIDMYSSNPPYDQTTTAPTQLTSPIWDELPNVNEMYSYLAYGDPRYETNTWTLDGGRTLHSRGIWLKKRSVIGTQLSDIGGVDGVDMRSVGRLYRVNSDTYRTGGRPDDSVIDQYFYLPATGYHYGDGPVYVSFYGYYWTRSPYPTSPEYVYVLFFNDDRVEIKIDYRDVCYPLRPDLFK